MCHDAINLSHPPQLDPRFRPRCREDIGLLLDREALQRGVAAHDGPLHGYVLFDAPEITTARVVFPVSRLVVDPERFLYDAHEPMAARGMGAVYEQTADLRPLRAKTHRETTPASDRPLLPSPPPAIDPGRGSGARPQREVPDRRRPQLPIGAPAIRGRSRTRTGRTSASAPMIFTPPAPWQPRPLRSST